MCEPRGDHPDAWLKRQNLAVLRTFAFREDQHAPFFANQFAYISQLLQSTGLTVEDLVAEAEPFEDER